MHDTFEKPSMYINTIDLFALKGSVQKFYVKQWLHIDSQPTFKTAQCLIYNGCCINTCCC